MRVESEGLGVGVEGLSVMCWILRVWRFGLRVEGSRFRVES